MGNELKFLPTLLHNINFITSSYMDKVVDEYKQTADGYVVGGSELESFDISSTSNTE